MPLPLANITSSLTVGVNTYERSVGLIKMDGTVDTTVAVTDAGLPKVPIGVYSDGIASGLDGQNGAGTSAGVHYVNKSQAVQLQLSSHHRRNSTNDRVLNAVNGQLYMSIGAVVNTVGTGLPPRVHRRSRASALCPTYKQSMWTITF